MAGVPFVDEVFKAVNCTVTWHLAEGEEIGAEQVCAMGFLVSLLNIAD